MQAQVNEPAVFVHAAFESQLCVPNEHSSRSRSNKEEGKFNLNAKILEKSTLKSHTNYLQRLIKNVAKIYVLLLILLRSSKNLKTTVRMTYLYMMHQVRYNQHCKHRWMSLQYLYMQHLNHSYAFLMYIRLDLDARKRKV